MMLLPNELESTIFGNLLEAAACFNLSLKIGIDKPFFGSISIKSTSALQ